MVCLRTVILHCSPIASLKKAAMDQHQRIFRQGDMKNFTVEPMPKSDYIRPMRLHFEQFGQKRFWDAVLSHASVSCVIYHRQRRSLLFVKQFRPAVYLTIVRMMGQNTGTIDTLKFPVSLGMTYELCSGLIDQRLTQEAVMAKEIREELGYQVSESQLERITSCRSGVGITGSCSTYFYCEVNDSMKVSSGGGNPKEQEFIETVCVPIEELTLFMFDESRPKPPSLLFGTFWFLQKKMPKL